MSGAKSENQSNRCTAYWYVQEILTSFLAVAELLEGMVARDGIEPPTPAFSGPRSTN